jgi:ATP-dependent Clp protease ATP-binding subunit ClpB
VAFEALKNHFRPEFINRLDEIVVYRRLGRGELRRVVDIQLGVLRKRLAQRELGLEISESAKDFLAEVGWDPQFGARPLKRAIQRHIEDALAQRLLGGEFLPGDTIRVDHSAGALSFTRKPASENASSQNDGAPSAAAQA